MHLPKSSLLTAICVGSLALSLGCQTPPLKKSESLTESFTVQRGTTAAELIEILGEPDDKYPFKEYSVKAVVWVYERAMARDSRMIITGTRENFYWDTVNRKFVTYEEPVLQPQFTTNTEVTTILLIDGKVSSWKREASQDRDVEGITR